MMTVQRLEPLKHKSADAYWFLSSNFMMFETRTRRAIVEGVQSQSALVAGLFSSDCRSTSCLNEGESNTGLPLQFCSSASLSVPCVVHARNELGERLLAAHLLLSESSLHKRVELLERFLRLSMTRANRGATGSLVPLTLTDFVYESSCRLVSIGLRHICLVYLDFMNANVRQ